MNQLRDAKVSLDMNKVANFVGSEFTVNALRSRICALKRIAEGGSPENSEFATPTNTPQKGKTASRTPSKKKQKIVPDEDNNSENTPSDQPRVVIDLVKKEFASPKAEKKEELTHDLDTINKYEDMGEEEEDKLDVKDEIDYDPFFEI
ncbi:uncharacterized protein N7511_005447 [Penicillium nucicola]|uniref:uncharacterized protein n=1 Tax=Penicillium nucicola TaxID=1850975 RepID=UPI002545AC1D|nr:uncharacterized protein N7511_005447 [Penicillium nucicola]KAJ5762065.1 hypothetical protein N7511_005447 [Penicillium nucicola]